MRKVAYLAVLLTVGVIPHVRSQQQPGLPAAIARLQANDPAGAAEILEALVKREPKNGRAWRNLGLACQLIKKFDRSDAAYRQALVVEPEVLSPLYALGVVNALRMQPDEAFRWLEKAKASRKIDMTQMEADADLASLKSDPRFAKLLPAPHDFENPFVEQVKILREWDGEAANDQFGWIARNIGDVDGDGVADVVTSAPTNNRGGANAGRVYVYSTKTGKLLWQADGNAGDQLGLGVEGAGDTNHDGIPDVIASAPGGGYAKVYSGRDGRVLLTVKAENKGDQFGRHVSGTGDVNHDGFADVMVGAPGNNAGGKGAGRAYVFSGKDGKTLLTLTGEREGDGFGSAVAGFADAKHMLLMVGAPRAGTCKCGRTFVYDELSAKPKFTIEADETGAALGAMFLSVPGDVDGDGFPDVYASDWSNRAKGFFDGARLHSFRQRRASVVDLHRRNRGRRIRH